jgi:phosphopantothenoylcysteine decarboxylase / phosphopantothenate---cysteine ligase
MRVLVTGGPTREYIDDVRFITNASSGRMGVALADDALMRGWDVTLVMGPFDIKPVRGVKVVDVVSSDEMTRACLDELGWGYDLLVSAAAIGDYTVVDRFRGKISSDRGLNVRLKPAKKLIREARNMFPELVIVAFKALHHVSEDELICGARKLLEWADVVVANDVGDGIFGCERTRGYIVSDEVKRMPDMSKKDAAKLILDAVQSGGFLV